MSENTKPTQRERVKRYMEDYGSITQLEAIKDIGVMRQAAGIEVESLNKASVPEIVKETEDETVKRLLEIRQELSLSSVKKYEAIDRSKCKDGRIRGLFQYYGASRTGRFAGRLVQVQNLRQNHLADLDLARQLEGEEDIEDWNRGEVSVMLAHPASAWWLRGP